MSNRFNPFNNDKPAVYIIWAFIALVVLFLAVAARAETEFELGATFMYSNYSDGSALMISETWDGKYLIGFGIVGDQKSEGDVVKSNMLVQAQRLVSYKDITLGLGVAGWQHESRLIGAKLGFSLSLGYALGNWNVRYRHYSNGGTAYPNSGQDILLVGYRFR